MAWRLKTFTVFGIYADNAQRFATSVLAKTPSGAEKAARREADSGLLIAGVIHGAHTCRDTRKMYGYE